MSISSSDSNSNAYIFSEIQEIIDDNACVKSTIEAKYKIML